MTRILPLNQNLEIPLIHWFDQEKVLEIKGKSLLGKNFDLYPLFEKLEEVLLTSSELCVNIYLEYFDISTTKALFKLFKRLEEKSLCGKTISVNWLFEEEDEDLKLAGQIFKEMAGNIDFKLVIAGRKIKRIANYG